MSIHIINWFLTRKCNLSCDYCRISTDYDSPTRYEKLRHFFLNEMKTDRILKALEKIKRYNPNCFHIFFGGEPTIRNDLSTIIKYCHKEDINYTIITNLTDQSKIFINDLIKDVKYLNGLTASIDPMIMDPKIDKNDRVLKSLNGIVDLYKYSDFCSDLVAEITVDNTNYQFLLPLVERLTELGINSDITFIDIAKNNYYDFSNITDPKLLVNPTDELKDIFDKIINSNLNVHMKETLLPKIFEILPSNLDCEIEKDIHNITVDADGTIRLCTRIRGVETPLDFNIDNFISDDGKMDELLKLSMELDRKRYCQGCNHSCLIMSKLLSENEDSVGSLIHK